jgi:hypothetical protein
MRLVTLGATLATVAALLWMMSFSLRPSDSLFVQPPAAHASGAPGPLSPHR